MIESWYPIQIYFHDNIENPGEIFQEIKFAENEIEKFYKPDVWNDNVLSTFGSIHNIIYKFNLTKLNLFLYNHVLNYITELNLKPLRFYLFDSWFNKIEKHGYQDRHFHNYETISGCYYFEDSLYKEEGIRFFIIDKFGKEEFITYPFCTNRLILFPGLLEHAVKYKKTDGVRKSISFNFKLEY
jgi:hypothetical protein